MSVTAMKPICAHCGKPVKKSAGHLNRSRRQGRKLFCNRVCFGLDRRLYKSVLQKKTEKRLYDLQYRAINLAMITANKRAYFQRTYDPAKAAIVRKSRMHLHVEYCRRPAYRAYKQAYDRSHLAKRYYGAFWESALLARQIDDEVTTRLSKYDIRLVNGILNKSQKRRREYESQYS